MIEAVRVDPIIVDKDRFSVLWNYLSEEYKSINEFVNQLLLSSCYKGLVDKSNLFFVADGFENRNFRSNLFEKIEIFGAINTDVGLIVLRGIKFSISPLLLAFSRSKQMKQEDSVEIVLKSILNVNRFIIKPNFSKLRDWVLSLELVSGLSIIDDYGEPVYSFPEYIHLGSGLMADYLKTIDYSVVGTPHYTTKDIPNDTLCVLVARNDNMYDDHAVQVFRWIPTRKENFGEEYVHPLYRLGYIPRTQNRDLHETMFETNNQILFGLYKNDKLSIIGNLKDLEKEPYCWYVLPYSLFNLLMK